MTQKTSQRDERGGEEEEIKEETYCGDFDFFD